MAGVPARVTRTGRLSPVVPGGLIAMAPLNIPEPLSADGFTVTWNDPGKLPEVGNTDSHVPPLSMIGAAVNAVMLAVLLDTVTVFEIGTVLPAPKLKLSALGVADRLVVPEEFTFRVTGIVTVLPPGPDTLMKPTSVPVAGVPSPMDTWIDSGDGPDLGVTSSQLLSE